MLSFYILNSKWIYSPIIFEYFLNPISGFISLKFGIHLTFKYSVSCLNLRHSQSIDVVAARSLKSVKKDFSWEYKSRVVAKNLSWPSRQTWLLCNFALTVLFIICFCSVLVRYGSRTGGQSSESKNGPYQSQPRLLFSPSAPFLCLLLDNTNIPPHLDHILIYPTSLPPMLYHPPLLLLPPSLVLFPIILKALVDMRTGIIHCALWALQLPHPLLCSLLILIPVYTGTRSSLLAGTEEKYRQRKEIMIKIPKGVLFIFSGMQNVFSLKGLVLQTSLFQLDSE